MEVSKRLQSVSESQTLVMTKKARALAATGVKVINLSIGEPDFDTPTFISDAAKQAIDDGWTHYPPVAGYPELRQAISKKFKDQNNLDYAPEQIVVSGGAKHSITNVIFSLINDGDEVIIPAPYWVSYPEMVKLAGGVPVVINSDIDTDYTFDLDDLKQAISGKTKIVLFSSPCNPSGTVFSESFLKEVAAIIDSHPDIIVISDEIYEHIQYGQKHTSIGSLGYLKDRVVTVNGLSKGFAMTGWRIGFLGAPLWIAKAVEKLQGQFTSGTNSVAQRAAITALEGSLDDTKRMRETFEARRKVICDCLSEIDGINPNFPKGAFYVFPDVSAYFGKSYNGKTINSSTDLCLFLLENAHVSIVGGDAFGNPKCIRISYAASEADLLEAMDKVKIALAKLT
ncbi:MAG: pyridoxal phosphate-dependent aminotransferase [Bacteroidetes bacterium]|jgi:aspartate aminotransferase|nr:pyridoxal phosphate-dependent aminotransferase [Bacteroidota bacterium]